MVKSILNKFPKHQTHNLKLQTHSYVSEAENGASPQKEVFLGALSVRQGPGDVNVL
jgi:hypothetical protein